MIEAHPSIGLVAVHTIALQRLQNLWDGIDLFAAVMARLGHEWKERPAP
jgi:hypothetical protein